MKMTESYGVNCSNRNEFGEVLDPKPAFGITDHGGMAAHASRGLDTPELRACARAFFEINGTKPTILKTTKPFQGLKSLGFILTGIGFISIDIVPDSECDELL